MCKRFMYLLQIFAQFPGERQESNGGCGGHDSVAEQSELVDTTIAMGVGQLGVTQPIGTPMRQHTHCGFRRPPTWVWMFSPPCLFGACPDPVEQFACGLAHVGDSWARVSRHCDVSRFLILPAPRFFPEFGASGMVFGVGQNPAALLPLWFGPPFSPSDALGVENIFTAVDSPSPDVSLKPLRLWFPFTVTVGQSLTATPRGVPIPLPFWCFSISSAFRVCHDSRLSPSFGFVAVGVGHSNGPGRLPFVLVFPWWGWPRIGLLVPVRAS
jgi:hypothetical protein